MRALVLAVLLACAANARASDERLPLSVAERISACSEVEDADPARAIALADSVLAEPVPAAPVQRGEATGCRGWARAILEQREDARRDALALGELAMALPAGRDRVRFLRRAGTILHRSGDRVGAIDRYAQAVSDAEAQGLEVERIPLLVNLGVLNSEVEENDRARVNYEQALALMARLGDFRYEAPVRFNLGLTLNGSRRHAEAIPHLRRTLELLQSPTTPGGLRQQLMTKIALSNALQETGASAEAAREVDEILAVDASQLDVAARQQIRIVEAERLEDSGRLQASLDVIDHLDTSAMNDINRWTVVKHRARLFEKLGRSTQAIAELRKAAEMRETYLREQNHERLAGLEAHLRDREQRAELERLQARNAEQDRQMADDRRRQWIGFSLAAFLLAVAAGGLLWQRSMNRRLWLASRTDPLTGLANRRAMAEHLRLLGAEATTTALLLIDVDHFKRINDERGHDMGDEVLVSFAERLRARAGAAAQVARWGGEEFLVVLPRADADTACALADALRHELARPINASAKPLAAAVSIGIANLPLPGMHRGPDAWHASLQLADAALYLAKRSGRDAWVCYWIDREIPDWPPERLGSESALARSLGLVTPRASRPLDEPGAADA